jgi:hypothetical protein
MTIHFNPSLERVAFLSHAGLVDRAKSGLLHEEKRVYRGENWGRTIGVA